MEEYTNSININIRFSDADTYTIPIKRNDTVNTLIQRSIIAKCKLEDIKQNQIPENIISKFKIVYKGKIIIDKDLLISSIDNITVDSIFHCIFPNLSKDDIDSIYNNLKVSDDEINQLLSSDDLRNLLKNKEAFTFITEYINSRGANIVPNKVVNIETNIIEPAIYQYEKQLNDLKGMGFGDGIDLVQLLNEYNGNIQSVINELFN